MRKIKLNTSESKNTTVETNPQGDSSLKNKNQKQELGKTQDIEDAEIINPSEKIDEIIKNNDKFETINVIMKILCKELGIPEDSGSREISEALKGVAERYYKSMEDWRELNKNGQKQDIRQ